MSQADEAILQSNGLPKIMAVCARYGITHYNQMGEAAREHFFRFCSEDGNPFEDSDDFRDQAIYALWKGGEEDYSKILTKRN
ncbi:MAG: hypothetical protein HPZ89_08095 [Oscillospiraceae bacterium]|nr:hypothetical protein [Oscillospiraceae bacterium]SFJ56216.1 hypothetical protein SAMN02910435_02346 [Ruminococcaceae bacterium D5]